MRPRPTTPRVLPWSSTPSHLRALPLPATSAAWAWGTLRAWASSRAMACSAAERTFDSGAFTTITPRRVAASTSTLSSPMPARPTTTRSVPASSTSAVTWVAERTMRACGAARWRRAAPPGRGRAGRRPRGRRRPAPRGRARRALGDEYPCHVTRRSSLGPDSRAMRCRSTDVCSARLGPRRRRPYSAVEELAEARDPLDDGVVAERVGQAEVAGGAEGLAGDDGHVGLVDGHLGQVGRGATGAPARRRPEQALHRREGVEGALGLDAGDARASR